MDLGFKYRDAEIVSKFQISTRTHFAGQCGNMFILLMSFCVYEMLTLTHSSDSKTRNFCQANVSGKNGRMLRNRVRFLWWSGHTKSRAERAEIPS